MSIVGVIGNIGGTGKTMVSVLLASEWARRGKNVLLLDADPIGLAMYWGGLAKTQPEPHPAVEGFDAALRERSIDVLASSYELIVIDCPPSEDHLTLRVIAMADLALIPCRARSMDVEPLAAVAALIAGVRAEQRAAEGVVLLSRRSLQYEIEPELEAEIRAVGLPVLATQLHQRVILQQAFESGAGASDFAPSSPAEAEIEAIASEIEDLLLRTQVPRTQR